MGWNKYHAKRTLFSGISFPSKLEADTWGYLLLRQKAGEISELKHHDTVYLTKAKISYQADFKFLDHKTNHYHWAEAKGAVTERWRLIRRLWEHYGAGPLEIYKGNNRGVYLTEVIRPACEDLQSY